MKKYYRIVGCRSAVFSMDADIPMERVCEIMKCKKVREISYEEFMMPTRPMNINYFMHKLRLMKPKKSSKLTRLKRHSK